MQFTSKRLAALMGAALALSGIGAAAAVGVGGSSAASAPPAAQPQATAAADPTEANAPDRTADPAEPTAPDATSAVDGDTLQQGDQTSPDNQPGDAAELAGENAAAENAPEQVEANEPAPPGGGHRDAPGQNVDHQFQGVE